MFDISLPALAAQVFTGLVLGGIFVLLAIGLSLIFGLMTVVNFSHGALYMLGAFVAFTVLGRTGSFWAALVLAPLVLVETVKVFWGKIGLTLDPPREMAGAVNLGFMNFPVYRLFVIAVTAIV